MFLGPPKLTTRWVTRPPYLWRLEDSISFLCFFGWTRPNCNFKPWNCCHFYFLIPFSNFVCDNHFSGNGMYSFGSGWLRSLYSVVGSFRIRQSSIWYAGSLGRWDERLIDQASDVPSIIFFIISYRLRALKTLYFYFCKVLKKLKKINWKDFCKEFCKKLWKKIILG